LINELIRELINLWPAYSTFVLPTARKFIRSHTFYFQVTGEDQVFSVYQWLLWHKDHKGSDGSHN